jgi:hypothetical protein
LDASRIKQKRIRNFYKTQIEKGIVFFEDFQPSVTAQTDSSQFDYNIHRFSLNKKTTEAWNAYLEAHPAVIWKGKVVSFGFVYSPVSNNVIFASDPYPGLETGQVFFIEMRVLFKLVRFPVCFIVTQIDKNKKSITFSYVATGQSKGSQTIILSDDGKDGTKITHSSIHQTENWLRDKTLYPIYHLKAIGEVHRNIQKLLEKQLN